MQYSFNTISFLTTSPDKFLETKLFIESNLSFKINLVNIKEIHLQEIQGSSEQIILNKLHQAAKLIDGPVLVEDSAFSVIGMNTMPGPYIKDFFTQLGNKKIYQFFKPFLNKKIYNYDSIDKSYLGFILNNPEGLFKEPIIWKGETFGNIIDPINQEYDEYNWCFFFVPEGESVPYGNMTKEQKNRVSARQKSLKQLCDFLESNKNIFDN